MEIATRDKIKSMLFRVFATISGVGIMGMGVYLLFFEYSGDPYAWLFAFLVGTGAVIILFANKPKEWFSSL